MSRRDTSNDSMNNLLNEKNIDLENYRKLVKSYIDLHLYSAALFWADKVLSLSNEDPKDVCTLAHCMYLMKQYHRAAHLIRRHGLEKTDVMCYYLTVRSLLEAKEYNEALQVISESEICTNMTQSGITFTDRTDILQDAPKNVQSAILYVKGRVYEAMDNRAVATEFYKQALQCDVYSYQAFEALVQNQMLSAAEERELLESLPFAEQCTEGETELLRLLYESKLKKYQEPNKKQSLVTCSVMGICISDRLADNLDMEVTKAERLYYNCEYHQCFALTEKILRKDPYHNSCLPVHIACLVELKKTNALFYLAHKLVDLYPEMALAWFAVGCYYYSIDKSDQARRYLAKATALDRLFGPAWLAYGHSFAVENEHDQAMAAYFKASQLMKGCHLPLLYIGLECGLTNNIKLADKFFQQAQGIAPNDPFVIHEMGVICFYNLDYKNAERLFKEAMKRIQGDPKDVLLPSKWEALLNNLGHTCRKMKKYEEALGYHQQALVLDTLNPSTYSAIGFIHALMGNTQEAVDAFHRALGLRRDDTFTTTMLGYVMEQIIEETLPYPDAPTEIPKYKSANSEVSLSVENSSNVGTSDDPNIDKLRVNLFSGWRENSSKGENNTSDKLERSQHVSLVNYSTSDTSEVEMLDSSTAHIEYN
ncbi:cell division cycle protein 16 homolog [Odontomachus brunneus]|uniref:cell division cycle protein 16 homolog n=1 Tax=Odontomachus brunneus TaxID=486640 RepID=UPI0013F2A18E|nr:cell division cycle protein 16 homolog [Odontomachus brunneus]XP_032686385.1 cell division cycle protein 16 homolog [Odontomachus brunneus]